MMTPDEYLMPLRDAMWHMDAQLECQGWDQPAQLWLVVRQDGTNQSVVGMVPMPGWQFALDNTDNLQAALMVMRMTLDSAPADLLASLPLRHLYGVGLSTEAWMLRSKDNNTALSAEHRRVANERRIHKHKDRVEIRLLHVAPVMGEPMSLVHERGGVAEIAAGDGDAQFAMGGAVVDLLMDLASILATTGPA